MKHIIINVEDECDIPDALHEVSDCIMKGFHSGFIGCSSESWEISQINSKKSLTTIYCSECGYSDVETKMWVNPNTSNINRNYTGITKQKDCRCSNCKKHTELLTLIQLWEKLSEVEVDSDDNIETNFIRFPVGTSKFDVWHWFDERCPRNLHDDLLFPKEENFDWDYVLDKFCHDRFLFWKKEGKDVPIAFEFAFNETCELKHEPLKSHENPISTDALNSWKEYHRDAIEEVQRAVTYGKFNSDNVRLCDNCGIPMIKGYYLGGEFACSDECTLILYNGDEEQMNQDLSHAKEEDGECYWTEWDSIFY